MLDRANEGPLGAFLLKLYSSLVYLMSTHYQKDLTGGLDQELYLLDLPDTDREWRAKDIDKTAFSTLFSNCSPNPNSF